MPNHKPTRVKVEAVVGDVGRTDRPQRLVPHTTEQAVCQVGKVWAGRVGVVAQEVGPVVEKSHFGKLYHLGFQRVAAVETEDDVDSCRTWSGRQVRHGCETCFGQHVEAKAKQVIEVDHDEILKERFKGIQWKVYKNVS